MVAMLIVLTGFLRRIRHAGRDPEFRSVALLVAVLLVVGTVFYSNVEGWSLLDALYFSVVTLATVGYGDLSPHTAAGKIFTIFYLMLGIGVIVAFADRLMRGRPSYGHHRADASRPDTTGEPQR